MKRIRFSALTVVFASAAALAVGVGGASAAGQTGPYIAGEGICEPGRIIATSALVSASVNAYDTGGVFMVGGSQVVGFRAHLARLDEARGQWVIVASGNHKLRDAPLQSDPALNWFLDLQTKQWGTGGTSFAITRPGLYRVSYELFWFPNQFVREGYLNVWASAHREYRWGGAHNQQAYGACRY